MRTIVITGCSSGIGLETALAFARAKDRVYATMRDLSRGDKLLAAAKQEDLTLNVLELDVTAPSRFESVVGTIVEEAGGIDVLVNNAGALPIGAFEDVSETALRHTMEVNFFGPALLTQVVLPIMRQQQSGYVINISSLSGMASKGGDSVYAASKFALEGLSEGLRLEIARWNIKTALVEPGQYATSLFRDTSDGTIEKHPSEYHLYNEWLRNGIRNGAAGDDPRKLAELILEISHSNGAQFRWPADDVAKHVMSVVFAQSDSERSSFLRQVANMDWWIEGRDTPD